MAAAGPPPRGAASAEWSPMQLPLSRYPALATRNPEQAFASIKARQPGVFRFEPKVAPGRQWTIRVNFVSLGSVGITATRSAGYSLSSVPDGFFRLFLPLGTPFEVDLGRDRRVFQTGEPGIVPDNEIRAHFHEGFSTLLLVAPETVVMDALGQIDARMPLAAFQNRHFGSGKLPFGSLTSRLLQMLATFDEEDGALLDLPRYRRAQEELLLLHLARALAPGASLEKAAPLRIRRAIDYVNAHLCDDMRLAEIAAAAGCSLRLLQLAFREHLATTISGYILRLRLSKAHACLTRPQPGDSVTSVALACGFSHLGQFALAYRERYGERPSTTLRDARP